MREKWKIDDIYLLIGIVGAIALVVMLNYNRQPQYPDHPNWDEKTDFCISRGFSGWSSFDYEKMTIMCGCCGSWEWLNHTVLKWED